MATYLWMVLAVLMSVVGRPVAERPDLPIEVLESLANVVFVGTCERIEEKPSRSGGFEDTTYFHHMKVERVIRGADAVKAGDVVAVISSTRRWLGGGTPPTFGSGHRGMPAKGGRSRVYCTTRADGGAGREMVWLDAVAPNGWRAVERGVLFVGADDEYRSEVTLPFVAECLVGDVPGVIKPMHAFAADRATDALDVESRGYIAGLEKLEHAEAAVLYMRWRELDARQWGVLEQFFMTGRPVVGLRTSTHMLRMTDPALAALNDDVAIRVFGQKWLTHAGSQSRTRVLPVEGVDHPVVRGVKGGFVVRSWLYDVGELPADCRVLVWGVVEGKEDGKRQPLVWVREGTKETVKPVPRGGTAARRMAFTTLGHPEDFAHEEVRRLVEQMILWACGDESAIPAGGVAGRAAREYTPPATR